MRRLHVVSLSYSGDFPSFQIPRVGEVGLDNVYGALGYELLVGPASIQAFAGSRRS